MSQNHQGYICVIGAVNVDIIASSYVRLIHQDSNPGTVKISYGGVGRNIAENLCRLNQKHRIPKLHQISMRQTFLLLL